nr:reverse transcriptase domain-containing protein [Tanacetum cinerariifolium]
MAFWHLGPPPESVPWELDLIGVALDWVLLMLPLSCFASKLEAVVEALTKLLPNSLRITSSDVNDLGGKEVFVVEQEVVSTTVTTVTTKEITLSQALEALKTSKPKVKGIVIQEQEEPGKSTTTTATIPKQRSQDKAQEQEELSGAKKATLFVQLLEKIRKHFAAKRAEDKSNKPPTQTQKRKIMCNYLKNMEGYKLKQLKSFEFDKIQEMFDRAFKRVNTFEAFRPELVERKEKRAGEDLIQESTKKQNVEDDKETAKLQQLMKIITDKEEVTIDAIPLVAKYPRIVDWKIYKEGKKSYYQIVRADGKSHMYMVFSKMLESFEREDLEGRYCSTDITAARQDVAYAMPWKTLKKMITDKYYPRGEIKKLETKLWNLKVKGTDVLSYNQRFQELVLMCDRMFPEESDKVEKYIGGLPDMIHESVKASKPKTMQEVIEFATELMDQKILILAERQAKKKRKFEDTSRNNQNQQQPFKRNNVARAYTVGPGEKKPYEGSKPLCPK